VTKKHVTRSTGTKSKKEAVKVAAKWEAELHEGRYKPKSRITWEEFTEKYDCQYVSELAKSTGSKVRTVLDHFQTITGLTRLCEATAERVTEFQSGLREQGKSETTIKSYSAHLKAALRWAADNGLINEAPKVRMPKRAADESEMKGRPITLEEFERMLAKVESVVGKDQATGWKELGSSRNCSPGYGGPDFD
jgi:site-specific recombinase XerD